MGSKGPVLHDVELEKALLSILLTTVEQPHVREEIAGLIEPDDFHDKRHKVIYRAILAQGNGPVDVLSLLSFLEQKGERILRAAGGDSYVANLAFDPASFLMAEQYIKQLVTLARRRQLLDASSMLAAAGTKDDLEGGVAEALRLAQGALQRGVAKAKKTLSFLTADELLTGDWPEPVWAIPQMLPVGLALLGGKAKLGKSWLALQIALAVAAGGVALGHRVEAGPVLYLALEDPPHRLKSRMQKQGWTTGLPAHFMPVGQFEEDIADLRRGGGERLARQIELESYRLVVIDTLSRAVYGDQNDVQAMTAALSPVQHMALQYHCAVLMIDHHNKLAGTDAITDLLGSTAKGAVADTAWGLYRERGKSGARLAIIGRDVEDQTLALTFDGLTGCWQCEGDLVTVHLTANRLDLLDALEQMGWSTCGEIADALNRNKGTVYKDLQEVTYSGYVTRKGNKYALANSA